MGKEISSLSMFRSGKGFSLVEIMLVLVISGIAIFSTSAFFLANAREQTKIQKRLSNIELKRSILAATLSQIANNSSCFYELIADPMTNTFYAEAIGSPQPPVLRLQKLSSSLTAAPIVKIDENSSLFSGSVKVQTILVDYFQKTPNPNLYLANLKIGVLNTQDNSTKVISLLLNIRTAKTSTSPKKIESCLL